MPNRVAGIRASTTMIMARLRSIWSRTCGAPWVTSAGVSRKVSLASCRGYSRSNFPPGRKSGRIFSICFSRNFFTVYSWEGDGSGETGAGTISQLPAIYS
jgi:hypothetical protein